MHNIYGGFICCHQGTLLALLCLYSALQQVILIWHLQTSTPAKPPRLRCAMLCLPTFNSARMPQHRHVLKLALDYTRVMLWGTALLCRQGRPKHCTLHTTAQPYGRSSHLGLTERFACSCRGSHVYSQPPACIVYAFLFDDIAYTALLPATVENQGAKHNCNSSPMRAPAGHCNT